MRRGAAFRLLLAGLLAAAGILVSRTGAVEAAAGGEAGSLQQQIDAAPNGGTLVLKPGTYEGAVTIGKPLRIRAEQGALLHNGQNGPAIHIKASGVAVEGLKIEQESNDEHAAVLVTGGNASLRSLDIRTRHFGIMVRDAGHNEISGTSIVRITGGRTDDAREQDGKRNGIDLLGSHDNRIIGNTVSGMNDGIYLESSHRNQIKRNRIDRSRYGIHCMFTDGTVVEGNTGFFNVTGAMVMGVKDAVVTDNAFSKQSESVNSQGLLFFDVQTSRIYDNKVEGNRVGLYVEQSHRNEFRNNIVSQNFVGVQFLESDGNRFTANRFIGNVIEAEADGSQNNAFSGNFWESFRGIDADGDGTSDVSYAINPFFQRLTSATPAFQLFFQSPGMSFLESMYTSGKAEGSVDLAPLMKPGDLGVQTPSGSSPRTLWAGMLMLCSSLIIILVTGVTKK